MKLWQCVFVLSILIICMWMFFYEIIKIEIFQQRTAIEVNIVNDDINEQKHIVNNYLENIYPKRKIKSHIPKFMLELYEKSKMVKKDNLSKITPDIVRSVIPSYEGSHHQYSLENDLNNNQHLLVFNIPNHNKDENFLKAELKVLTLIEIKSALAMGIERQIKISLYNDTTNELIILEEKHIYYTNNTWISFNVSQAVQTIFLESLFKDNKTLKLIITVKIYQRFINNKTGLFKLSLMPVTENLEHDYPVLLLYYASAKLDSTTMKQSKKNFIVENNKSRENIRIRRSIEEDYEEESNKLWDDDTVNKAVTRKMRRMRNNCRRRPLYIDFAEIQYDTWIVQPSGYEAYQCAGKCFYPVAEHLSPTKHAIVQALLHSVSPSRAPRSCCVPTKLDSISVLYVDNQGVLTYRYAYKDMVVTECGCR